MKQIRKYKRSVSIFILLNFFFQLGAINQAYAVTGHSSMPEYRSFEPVATTNMVNMFNGGFSYNIPLLEVPNGYPINLSYSSGDVNNEAQASWAGLGWTVNPGAINRMKRGLPDDYNGAEVTYHSRMPKNWTISGGNGVSLEVLSIDAANASAGISYNNYNGIQTSLNFGLQVGVVSLNFEVNNGQFGFNPSINPGAIIAAAVSESRKAKKGNNSNTKKKTSRGESKKGIKKGAKAAKKKSSSDLLKTRIKERVKAQFSIGNASGSLAGSIYSSLIPDNAAYPVAVTPYKGDMVRFTLDLGVHTLPIQVAPQAEIYGSYVQQVYDDKSTKDAYGYLYNEGALDDESAIMDYLTENEKIYEKREVMIGMPQANYDNFNLTGEAMGGSFRLYRSDYGHYRKNKVKSSMNTFRGGVGADLPNPIAIEFTVGANLGYDRQDLTVSGWDGDKITEGDNYAFKTADNFSSNENAFYAFSGDKAANFSFSPKALDYLPVGAKAVPSGLKANLDINESHYSSKVDSRVARGSYIGQSTIGDFQELVTNGDFIDIPYKVYEKNLQLFTADGTTKSDYVYTKYDGDAIGELYTFNGDGVGYIYGLPLHTQNEKQIQYELGSLNITPQTNGLIASIDKPIDVDSKRKIGYESDEAYATQFLLTQIISPDYVDLTMNGPTEDDFGDYTRFNYKTLAGAQTGAGDNWYSYKTPYEGLSYDYGTLSSNKDDMGSMQYGEKELYYMHSVVSKTHAALFYTDARADGAEIDVNTGADLDAICQATGSGSNKLQKLTKIELYSLNDLDDNLQVIGNAKPIKTVHFEYDYTLCSGIPNSSNNGGKLTLKKVWFEYEGKKTSKISPYEFSYEYPDANIYANTPYSTFGMNFLPGDENPLYSPLNNDRWGNYRDYATFDSQMMANDGRTGEPGDLARFFPFVNQRPSTSFDPAAWHLKEIKLPSGGQIHVQYEQNDYTKVQDKDAMVMVPLDAGASGNRTLYDDEGSKTKEYYLDLAKVLREDESGNPWTSSTWATISNNEKRRLADQLFSKFGYGVDNEQLQKGERLYFNFLYSLIGTSRPDYSTINSEYIEGYARIHGYGFNNQGLYFTFKSDLSEDLSHNVNNDYYKIISYGDAKFSKKEFPRKVCDNFYSTQRKGIINGAANSLDPDGDKEGVLAAVGNVVNQAVGLNVCATMDPEMSFVRLTSPQNKLGGGVRVKRLLMYDDGIANGEDVLYGQEYDYTYEDGTSTGVATNEPSVGRRESPLVNPIDKDDKSQIQEILWGRDLYSQEGPIAEGMLPGASVGYARVKVSNIHNGKTSTGFEIHDFYTCADEGLSFRAEKSILDRELEQKIDMNLIAAAYYRKTPYLTQGFSVVTNEMHGKAKSVKKYPFGATDENQLITQTFEYFSPGEAIPVMGEDFIVSNVNMGRKSEAYSEHRQVTDISSGGSLGGDASSGVLFIPAVPIPLILPLAYATPQIPTAYYRESVYHTHATTKVTHYPAILKKITNTADGVTHVTENKVFDKYTGDPLIVTSYDDFEHATTNQEYFASSVYTEMSAKSLNEKAFANAINVTAATTNSVTLEFDVCANVPKFSTGDFVELNQSGGEGLFHIKEITGPLNSLYIMELEQSALANHNIAVGQTDVYVIKSGRTNQLNTKVGNINYQGTYTNQAIPANIQNFLSALNTSNNNLGGAVSLSTFNLQLVEEGCESGQSATTIQLSDLGSNVTQVKVNDEKEYCGTPDNPHPLVAHLNNYLNLEWGNPVSGNFPNCSGQSGYVLKAIDYPSYHYVENAGYANSDFDHMLNKSFSCVNGIDNYVLQDNGFMTIPVLGDHNLYDLGTGQFQNGALGLLLPGFNLGATVWSNEYYSPTGCIFGNVYLQLSSNLDAACIPYNSSGTIKEKLDFFFKNKFTDIFGSFRQNDLGELYFQTVGDNCVSQSTQMSFFSYKCASSVVRTGATDYFDIDMSTGQVYYISECAKTPIKCLQICTDALITDDVLTASATTFSDDWDYDENDYRLASTTLNAFESGKRGKWRPESQYVFREGISKDKNYNSGVFTLELFDWENPSNNDPSKWVLTSTTNKYSPNGDPIEDQNILGIKSTAQYGYNFTLPVAVAQNAADKSISYESFENIYDVVSGGQEFENGLGYYINTGDRVKTTAHTGKYAIEINTAVTGTPVGNVTINDQILSEGLLVRAWLKTNKNVPSLEGNIDLRYTVNNTAYKMGMNKVSSAGEWSLYEAIVINNLTSGVKVPFEIVVDPDVYAKGDVYLDDIRIQPMQSEMVCYVYDHAQRLVATFDDQHFAMIYEYNSEGELVRKLKETIEGIKTISETQYNTVGEDKW